MKATHILIDLETSGLDESYCVPLEISAVPLRYSREQGWITTADAFYSLIAPPAEGLLDDERGAVNAETYALGMHRKNGLLDEIAAGATYVGDVGVDLARYLDEQCGPKPILVGNNPQFDRRFLDEHFACATKLSFRQLDVSSLRYAVAAGINRMPDTLKAAVHAFVRQSGDLGDAHRTQADTVLTFGELCAYQYAIENGASALEARLVESGCL